MWDSNPSSPYGLHNLYSNLYGIYILNRDGIVQPCRIGEDGRPEAVGHVLEFIENLPQQQIKPAQDED